MGTKILTDIHNDLKLLITSLTGFEEPEEGFRRCERFVTSNISHHRYLSIDSHATKRLIAEVKKKFIIHGNYDVAREFERLVDTFLTSFDFDQHPQYDLQWSLLSLVLELSNDTSKSSIDSLQSSTIDKSLSISEGNEVDEINWAEHLREGQEDFFSQYQSSSESDWSDDEEEEKHKEALDTPAPGTKKEPQKKKISETIAKKKIEQFEQVTTSRNWLNSNVENSWWNDINRQECQVQSNFSHAHLCSIYHKEVQKNHEPVGTITEYQALREVLWMFHVPMEMVLYQEEPENKFCVRKDISIPSLTPAAFNSAFSSLTPYFSMINRLRLFEKNYQIKYEGDELPPLTLEAYVAAMKQHTSQIKENIIAIERKVMRQDDINTFLTLTKNLQADLKRISLLDGIHCSVTDNLIEEENHIKAYRLLANIYHRMEASSSREQTNLCVSIYLSSLSVYLNIVDTWLSEGRLEDFRREFLINKLVDNSKSEDDMNRVTFIITKCTDSSVSDPILMKLFQKVMDIGRSIEILVTLDRLSDMWKTNAEQFENNRVPLSDEFVSQVLSELSTYGTSGADEPDVAEEVEQDSASVQSEKFEANQSTSDLEENIKQQILRINNPFLMKAFQTYLPTVLNIDTVDAKVNHGKNDNKSTEIFEKLEGISPYILPFRKVLENVLDGILDRRYSCAAKLVKNILVKEYRLEDHLKLMRSIYMMEREHVMKRFFQQEMFSAIENHSAITNPYSLRIFMEEVLPDEWRDSKSDNHWSLTISDIRTRQVLQAVDGTVLHYSINWPINMVLTDDVLEKYNTIFKFQLKLKWAVWTLSDLRFKDLEESSGDDMNDILQHFYARRLECLRFWLLHAIGSIHSYLSGQVLQSLGSILEKKLTNADNLYSIIEAHNDYLEKVHEHCLQTPQFSDILITINNMLGMCAHVRDRWKNGAKQLIASDLDIMENSYTKYHTYLALALHNAIQDKEADFHKLSIKLQAMKDRLAEVAHQCLPPSGIPIPIPPLVRKKNQYWTEIKNNDDRRELSLNEYDDTFLFLWYQSIGNSLSVNLSRYDIGEELLNLRNENNNEF